MEEERETYIRLDFISLIAVPRRADSSEEWNNGLFHMADLAKLAKGGKRIFKDRTRPNARSVEGSEVEGEGERNGESWRQPSRAGVLPVACVVCVFRAPGSELRQEGAHMLLEL